MPKNENTATSREVITSSAIYRELVGHIMCLSFGPISTDHSRRHDHRHHRHD